MGFRARKRRAEERTTRTGGAPLRFPRAPPSSLPEAQLRLSMGSLPPRWATRLPRVGQQRKCTSLPRRRSPKKRRLSLRAGRSCARAHQLRPAAAAASTAPEVAPHEPGPVRSIRPELAPWPRGTRRKAMQREEQRRSRDAAHRKPLAEHTYASLGEGCAAADVYCVTGDRRDTRSRVGVDQMFFPPRAVEGEKISKALGGGEGVTPVTCHRGGYRWRTCDR